MHFLRGKLLFLMTFFSVVMASFMNCQVFADVSISISSDLVDMTLPLGGIWRRITDNYWLDR